MLPVDGAVSSSVFRHRRARVLDYLRANDRVGFEIANNHPRYLGVRGHGRVELLPQAGGEWLERLIARYLGERPSAFSCWLLSRRDEEVALRVRPMRRDAPQYDFGSPSTRSVM